MHTNHAGKNAARRRQEESGQSYAQALAGLRTERLAHRELLASEEYVPEGALSPDAPVPPELPCLVRRHIDVMARYFHEVLSHAYYAPDYGDWARIVLYRLTDALEHLNILIGTITAHLQHNHVSPDAVRSYLQVRDQRHVDAFVTRSARSHLTGLLGKPPTGGDDGDIHYVVGRGIAGRDGWVEPEREDTLEGFLAAMYSGYPYDSQAFDDLPQRIREVALPAARLVLDAQDETPSPSGATGRAEGEI
jgi:hypothetical protein